MRPNITCHMITSLDGRLYPERWSDPADGRMADLIDSHYDSAAERLQAEGWIVGRKTMAAYAEQDDAPRVLDTPKERPPHLVDFGERKVAVSIDPCGRLRYGEGDIDGHHVVAVLSQRVPDDYLTRLRDAGVSYLFAGPRGDSLAPAMATLGDAFAVSHLILEGGGTTNGAFLAAGLIDQVSTLICPAIDGLAGIPAIFEHSGPSGSFPAEGQHLRLLSCETLEGGVVWLRHEVTRS